MARKRRTPKRGKKTKSPTKKASKEDEPEEAKKPKPKTSRSRKATSKNSAAAPDLTEDLSDLNLNSEMTVSSTVKKEPVFKEIIDSSREEICPHQEQTPKKSDWNEDSSTSSASEGEDYSIVQTDEGNVELTCEVSKDVPEGVSNLMRVLELEIGLSDEKTNSGIIKNNSSGPVELYTKSEPDDSIADERADSSTPPAEIKQEISETGIDLGKSTCSKDFIEIPSQTPVQATVSDGVWHLIPPEKIKTESGDVVVSSIPLATEDLNKTAVVNERLSSEGKTLSAQQENETLRNTSNSPDIIECPVILPIENIKCEPMDEVEFLGEVIKTRSIPSRRRANRENAPISHSENIEAKADSNASTNVNPIVNNQLTPVVKEEKSDDCSIHLHSNSSLLHEGKENEKSEGGNSEVIKTAKDSVNTTETSSELHVACPVPLTQVKQEKPDEWTGDQAKINAHVDLDHAAVCLVLNNESNSATPLNASVENSVPLVRIKAEPSDGNVTSPPILNANNVLEQRLVENNVEVTNIIPKIKQEEPDDDVPKVPIIEALCLPVNVPCHEPIATAIPSSMDIINSVESSDSANLSINGNFHNSSNEIHANVSSSKHPDGIIKSEVLNADEGGKECCNSDTNREIKYEIVDNAPILNCEQQAALIISNLTSSQPVMQNGTNVNIGGSLLSDYLVAPESKVIPMDTTANGSLSSITNSSLDLTKLEQFSKTDVTNNVLLLECIRFLGDKWWTSVKSEPEDKSATDADIDDLPQTLEEMSFYLQLLGYKNNGECDSLDEFCALSLKDYLLKSDKMDRNDLIKLTYLESQMYVQKKISTSAPQNSLPNDANEGSLQRSDTINSVEESCDVVNSRENAPTNIVDEVPNYSAANNISMKEECIPAAAPSVTLPSKEALLSIVQTLNLPPASCTPPLALYPEPKGGTNSCDSRLTQEVTSSTLASTNSGADYSKVVTQQVEPGILPAVALKVEPSAAEPRPFSNFVNQEVNYAVYPPASLQTAIGNQQSLPPLAGVSTLPSVSNTEFSNIHQASFSEISNYGSSVTQPAVVTPGSNGQGLIGDDSKTYNQVVVPSNVPSSDELRNILHSFQSSCPEKIYNTSQYLEQNQKVNKESDKVSENQTGPGLNNIKVESSDLASVEQSTAKEIEVISLNDSSDIGDADADGDYADVDGDDGAASSDDSAATIKNSSLADDQDKTSTVPAEISESPKATADAQESTINESPIKRKSRYEMILERQEREKSLKAAESSSHIGPISDPKLAQFCEKQRQNKRKVVPLINALPLEDSSEIKKAKKKGNSDSETIEQTTVELQKSGSKGKTNDKVAKRKATRWNKESEDDDDSSSHKRQHSLKKDSEKPTSLSKSTEAKKKKTEDSKDKQKQSDPRLESGMRFMYRGSFLAEDSNSSSAGKTPNAKKDKKKETNINRIPPVEELHAAADVPGIDNLVSLGSKQNNGHYIGNVNPRLPEQPKRIGLHEYKRRSKDTPSFMTTQSQSMFPDNMNSNNCLDPRINRGLASRYSTQNPNWQGHDVPQVPHWRPLPQSSLPPVVQPTQVVPNTNYSAAPPPVPVAYHETWMPRRPPPPPPQPVPVSGSSWTYPPVSNVGQYAGYVHPPPGFQPAFMPPLPVNDHFVPPPPPVSPPSDCMDCFDSPPLSQSPASQYTPQTTPPFIPNTPGQTYAFSQAVSPHGSFSPRDGERQKHSRPRKDLLLLPEPLKDAIGMKIITSTEVLLIILSWNTNWLYEEMKTRETPTISKYVKPVSWTYANLSDHFNTYLPLLMYETWSRIIHSWKGTIKVQGFYFDIGSIEAKGDMVEVQCKSTVSASGSLYPSEGQILLLKFTCVDGQSRKIFGYVSSCVCSELNPQMPAVINDQRLLLYVKVIYRLQDVDRKAKVRIQSLYNVKTMVKQVDALRGIEFSALYSSILNPSKPECKRLTLERIRSVCNSSTVILRGVSQIVDGIALSVRAPRLVVVDAPAGTDVLNTLIALIEHVQTLQTTSCKMRVLLCTRSGKRLEEIGFRLVSSCGGSPSHGDLPTLSTVILSKPNIIPPDLKRFTLEERFEQQLRLQYEESGKIENFEEAAENAYKVILKSCDVVLSIVTTCHDHIVHQILGPKSDSQFAFCIIDEAHMCTESETLVPLLYGIRKLVLMGDPGVRPRAWNRTCTKYNFDRSLAARIITSLAD